MKQTAFLVIPILGLLKNYVKYKKINFFLFLRTPFLNYLFFMFLQLLRCNTNKNLLLAIIYERSTLFIYKIINSFMKDTYNLRKDKYKIKYNLTYNS